MVINERFKYKFRFFLFMGEDLVDLIEKHKRNVKDLGELLPEHVKVDPTFKKVEGFLTNSEFSDGLDKKLLGLTVEAYSRLSDKGEEYNPDTFVMNLITLTEELDCSYQGEFIDNITRSLKSAEKFTYKLLANELLSALQAYKASKVYGTDEGKGKFTSCVKEIVAKALEIEEVSLKGKRSPIATYSSERIAHYFPRENNNTAPKKFDVKDLLGKDEKEIEVYVSNTVGDVLGIRKVGPRGTQQYFVRVMTVAPDGHERFFDIFVGKLTPELRKAITHIGNIGNRNVGSKGPYTTYQHLIHATTRTLYDLNKT